MYWMSREDFLFFFNADFQHRKTKIRTHHFDFAFGVIVKRDRQITGARANVQNRIGAIGFEFSNRPPTPIVIGVHRQQMVHAVVVRCDLAKHRSHTFI